MTRLLLFLISCLLVALRLQAEELPFITLTDDQGRSMEVQILGDSVDKSGWQVKRRDGRIVDVPLLMLSGDSLDSIASEMSRRATGATAGADRSLVSVQALTVKRVNGKYRYFFQISNGTPAPFLGNVKIVLQNAMKGISNGQETFNTSVPMPPGGSTTVYLDVNTGPRSVHEDASVVGFSYEVKSDGNPTVEGVGNVSEIVVE